MSKDTKLTDAEKLEKSEKLKKLQEEADLLKSELGVEDGEDKTDVTESDLEKSLKTLEEAAKDSIEKCDTGKKGKKGKKDDDEDEGMGKSFADYVDENEDAAEGVEVSPFLDGLVKSIGKHMDGVAATQDDIMKSLKAAADTSIAMAGVLKAQADEIAGLKKSISELEATPSVRKSELVGKPEDRTLGKSEGEKTDLTKAQVTSAMEELAKSDKISATEHTMFLQTGQLNKSTVALIEQYYKK